MQMSGRKQDQIWGGKQGHLYKEYKLYTRKKKRVMLATHSRLKEGCNSLKHTSETSLGLVEEQQR